MMWILNPWYKANRSGMQKVETLEGRLKLNPYYFKSSKRAQEAFLQYESKKNIEAEVTRLERLLEGANEVIMKDELKAMKRVLRRLEFVDADNVVQAKGRVGCEINAADELLITELFFCGVFNDLTAAQIASLLSVLIFEEKVGLSCGPLCYGC